MRERKVIKHTSRFVSHHHRPLPRLTLLDCLEIIYLLKVEEVREVRRGLRNLRVESHGLFRRRFAGEDGESTHRLEGYTAWRRFASAECSVTEYTSRFKLRIMNSASSDLSAKGRDPRSLPVAIVSVAVAPKSCFPNIAFALQILAQGNQSMCFS